MGLATVTYPGSGVVRSSVTPLLPQLKCAWAYSVLAASTDPDDPHRTVVLLHMDKGAGEYVVYRVDTLDGSLHGGNYCGPDYPLAFRRFGERIGLTLAKADADPSPASLTPVPPSSEDAALFARVAAFMEDDGSITDGERYHLLQDVLARAEPEGPDEDLTIGQHLERAHRRAGL